MKLKTTCLGLLLFVISVKSFAQGFYALNAIQKIEIWFQQSNWDYMLDTAKQGSDSYTLSKWVKINGQQFDSAGVKYKGNSSYNPSNLKNPLHIELDHFVEKDYQGFKDIKLSNGFHEPSFVREVMLYSMFSQYADCGQANFAQVYINGEYFGVYSNVEAVTKTFLSEEYYSDENTFVFADNGGCDLRYKGQDTTLYYNPYTMKSDFGFEDLMHLCDSLKNNISGIEKILDVDRTLWLHAYCNALVILDSYLGNSKHNYYLYEDHNGRFNPIIWDLNGGLGVFNKPDIGVSLTVPQMQIMTPMLHAPDTMWPFVKNILDVPMYRRMYIAHMKTIMEENIDNGNYMAFAQQLQDLIDTAVFSDTKKFSSYNDFHNNLDSNIIIGPKTIPGISLLMEARKSFLLSTPEFSQVAPVINSQAPSPVNPAIGSTVFLTTNVSGAVSVFVGFRTTYLQKFQRVLMLDDGLHGDGAAGDGMYGFALTMNTPRVEYFIYAENSDAGIFSPVRAEHEFHVLNATYPMISPGSLVINEILATNQTINQNGDGIFGDWIELYNPTANPLNLEYLCLTDDYTLPTKYVFPSGISVPAFGYQVVWAENTSYPGELNSEFKFAGSGEQAMISYPNGTVIDSITFPVQYPDTSFGRYPNGSGPFQYLGPTFNAENSPLSVLKIKEEEIQIQLFPNPNHGTFKVNCNCYGFFSFNVTNIWGRQVFSGVDFIFGSEISLNITNGIYFYRIETENKFVSDGKVMVIK